jgi:hypothetical protein
MASKAMVSFQGNELPVEFDSTLRGYHGAGTARPLKVHLTAHKFDRVIRSLLPFYGVDCPIAVYEDSEPADFVGCATLGAIEGWTPPKPLVLVIG